MRSGPPRSTRTTRPSATSASAATAASSRTCSSRWRSPRSRAIPRRCWPARARSSRPRSATTRPAPEQPDGRAACRATRGATPTPSSARSSTRSAGARRRVPRARRRERPRRPRGRRARRRRLLRQEHAHDHAAPRLLGRARDARHRGGARRDPAARSRLRRVPPLRRRVPDVGTRRAGRPRLDALPLVLDAVAGRRSRSSTERRSRTASTAATSARTSARGTAASRSAAPTSSTARPFVSLVDWLEADDEELRTRYDRLYVPRNDPRFLRRNALVAAGNVGGERERAAVAPYAASDDELLREHALWALERIEERT